MKTEFVLSFDIGNDGTLGDANVADVLQNTADRISSIGITDNRMYNIVNFNGKVMGHYGRYTYGEEE